MSPRVTYIVSFSLSLYMERKVYDVRSRGKVVSTGRARRDRYPRCMVSDVIAPMLHSQRLYFLLSLSQPCPLSNIE